MSPREFMNAARVPRALQPQAFGLWAINRISAPREDLLLAMGLEPIGWPDYTLLYRTTMATLHLPDGEVVMEDSIRELRRHLPIWLAARGRVLVTGLGLGCVVRGLLASPHVSRVDVIEIDGKIIDVVGAEFTGDKRCVIHHDDALKWNPARGNTWDFAWHDLWCEGSSRLQHMHADLFAKFRKRVGRQGAWNFPRCIGKRIGLLGAPR